MREAAQINPASALEGLLPHAIDEWQIVPGIWDAVRFDVDRTKVKGKYLLTGSTKLHKKAPLHSGIGRIVRIPLRSMSLFESGDSDGKVFLSQLFYNKPLDAFSTATNLEHLAYLVTRGGWPENIETPPSSSHIMPRHYLEEVAQTDIQELDEGTERDSFKVLALLRALARNTATNVSNVTLHSHINNASGSISQPTISSYLAALRRLYVLEEIPAWKPALRSKARLCAAPKRMLTDPSLAVAGLQISPVQLAKDLPTFGAVFESLCLRDLQIYACALEGRLAYYRDNSGLEVDAIVELEDGSYGAFEIKLNAARVDEAVETLVRFKRKMEKGGFSPPTCMVVVTGGGLAQKRADGIYVVPITSLRP